jgi:hypothetical protein
MPVKLSAAAAPPQKKLRVHPLYLLHHCRSDSNGEDLEGYAGAGLYESITMDPTETVRVDYSDDPITAEPQFRNKVGRAVTSGGGGPLDGLHCKSGGLKMVQRLSASLKNSCRPWATSNHPSTQMNRNTCHSHLAGACARTHTSALPHPCPPHYLIPSLWPSCPRSCLTSSRWALP